MWMSRYVNIEWLKAAFDEANEICFFYLNSESRETFEELKKIVEQAPSIDIVHCQDCKHAIIENGARKPWEGNITCELDGIERQWFKQDFCSYGERKDDE